MKQLQEMKKDYWFNGKISGNSFCDYSVWILTKYYTIAAE